MEGTAENAASPAPEAAETVANMDVLTKYKEAGKICNGAIKKVMEITKPGMRVGELCMYCDEYIIEETRKVYNKKSGMKKGIAFPCAISVNNYVGHFSPSTKDPANIRPMDMLKIECGAHIDGYIAVAAVTFKITETGTTLEFDGVTGNVLVATRQCVEACLRLLKPGTMGSQLREMVHKLAHTYGCEPIMGVCSHTIGRYNLDGSKIIVWKDTSPEKQADDCAIEENDIFVIDIVLSSGEGKPMEVEAKTNIYMKQPGQQINLKSKAARALISEVSKNHADFPFAIRNLQNAEANLPAIRLGINESQSLLIPYPVLCVNPNEIVGHAKLVIAVTKAGPIVISGMQLNAEDVKSETKIEDEELLKLLATSVRKRKNNKKKNNKKK